MTSAGRRIHFSAILVRGPLGPGGRFDAIRHLGRGQLDPIRSPPAPTRQPHTVRLAQAASFAGISDLLEEPRKPNGSGRAGPRVFRPVPRRPWRAALPPPPSARARRTSRPAPTAPDADPPRRG